MEFNRIVEKFNYSEEFAIVLRQAYNGLIEYYHDEELVFQALYNTPIVLVDNCYSYAEENGLISDSENGVDIVTNSDLKRCSGVYLSNPVIEYDNGYYILRDVKRAVLITNFGEDYSKGTLIHELCHLIKGYYHEYQITNNILHMRCGLIQSEYSLSYDGKKVNKTMIKEYGVGLEEGLNTLAEEYITKMFINEEYQASGYGVVKAIAENLMDDAESLDLLQILIDAQLYHDNYQLKDLLGEEIYILFCEVVDNIYKLSLEMFANAMDNEKLQMSSMALKEYITQSYLPIRSQIRHKLRESNVRIN